MCLKYIIIKYTSIPIKRGFTIVHQALFVASRCSWCALLSSAFFVAITEKSLRQICWWGCDMTLLLLLLSQFFFSEEITLPPRKILLTKSPPKISFCDHHLGQPYHHAWQMLSEAFQLFWTSDVADVLLSTVNFPRHRRKRRQLWWWNGVP